MTKNEIINKLISNHQKFTSYFTNIDDHEFVFSLRSEKWSAGQQAEHIFRSVSPLRTILRFPKWLIRFLFKKANRPSKTYEALIEKYHQKLERGGTASGRFIPGVVTAGRKKLIAHKIEKTVSGLCQSITKFSEKELDEFVLPHPLLGKLTLREMLYFTMYHVEHHHKLAIRNLASE